jgi:CRISPR-associated protein Cas2
MYLISYDIEDDHDRLQVSRLLEGFGKRVQKSVFECPLSKGQRHDLERRITKLELDSGFILIYRIDKKTRRAAYGQVPSDLNEPSDHAFVI